MDDSPAPVGGTQKVPSSDLVVASLAGIRLEERQSDGPSASAPVVSGLPAYLSDAVHRPRRGRRGRRPPPQACPAFRRTLMSGNIAAPQPTFSSDGPWLARATGLCIDFRKSAEQVSCCDLRGAYIALDASSLRLALVASAQWSWRARSGGSTGSRTQTIAAFVEAASLVGIPYTSTASP